MTKLTRKTQKIFGSTAGVNETGVIGSFAAGSPNYSTDPDTIQSLSNYLQGWYGVVVGQNSPAIQDMNALDFLITRQLAYIFESGIPEYDAATTYYTSNFAAGSNGQIFVSLADDNIGNALTDTSKWRLITGPNTVAINPSTQSPYTLTATDQGKTFLVDTSAGAMVFNLPAASLNFSFSIKDVSGSASSNNITVARNGSESIEGVAANYLLNVNYSLNTLTCNGTNWFLTGGQGSVGRGVNGQVLKTVGSLKSVWAWDNLNLVSSADFTGSATDGYDTIFYVTGASNRNLTLPPSASSVGRVLKIKKIDTGGGSVIIAGASGSVDGQSFVRLSYYNEYMTVICDGTNWFVLSRTQSSYAYAYGGSALNNGRGSSNTSVRCYTNNQNLGPDVTYTSDAVNGDSFTVNTSGLYCISCSDRNNSSLVDQAITLNQINMSSGVALLAKMTTASTYFGTMGLTLRLSAGDIIRHCSDPLGAMATVAECNFRITKVSE